MDLKKDSSAVNGFFFCSFINNLTNRGRDVLIVDFANTAFTQLKSGLSKWVQANVLAP